MKLNSAFLTSLLTLNLALPFISANVFAENNTENDRWFEIEVILFQQLNDKNTLKEQFPAEVNASNLPAYSQSFDLLERYLQPNLSNIKQFISPCDETNEQLSLAPLSQSISLPNSSLFKDLVDFTLDDFSKFSDTKLIKKVNNLTAANNEVGEIQNNSSNYPNDIVDSPLKFDLQKEALAKPIFSTSKLCIISQQEIVDLFDQEQLTNVNIDAFPIAGLPNKLNAAGIHKAEQPYLISDDALRLKDINQRLGWSKEFKPLFHFGWRQIGITDKKAIPLKLIAGKHFEHDYQQALAKYTLDYEEAKNIENSLLNQLASNQQSLQGDAKTNSDLSTQAQLEKVELNEKLQLTVNRKKQALNQLFSRENHFDDESIVDSEIDKMVSNIENQTLALLINNPNSSETDNIFHESSVLTKPEQPWYLEGFIKVHLDHYLFITADLNVFNDDEASRIIDHNLNEKIKLVNFSQNRRVITGEIHYFDHPYLGMIIQIRRFDPSKPKGEQVSQAIK